MWSRALAAGYYDHPPMVALWIAAGTALAGDGALGVRLLGPLAAALGSLLLAGAARDLAPGTAQERRRAGVVAAALMNATLMLGAGSVILTPDTPLLFFWTLALRALARLQQGADRRWWLVAGAALGAAGTSKYSALLMPPGVLLWVLAVPAHRRWLRAWPLWAGAALALACAAPVLAWNAAHGWAGLLKQTARAADASLPRALQYQAELFAGQLALATPLVGVLLAAGIAASLSGARRACPHRMLLAGTTALPAAAFVLVALGERVQANWPAILYPGACIAAAALAGRWRHLVRPGIALGLALTVLAWVQAVFAPLALPARLDPTLLRLAGWEALAHDIAAAARREGAQAVAATNYGHAALLARLLPHELAVVGLEGRWGLFRLPAAGPVLQDRTVLVLHSARRAQPPESDALADRREAGTLQRARGGMTAETFRLYAATGRAGSQPAALMPRPQQDMPQ